MRRLLLASLLLNGVFVITFCFRETPVLAGGLSPKATEMSTPMG